MVCHTQEPNAQTLPHNQLNLSTMMISMNELKSDTHSKFGSKWKDGQPSSQHQYLQHPLEPQHHLLKLILITLFSEFALRSTTANKTDTHVVLPNSQQFS